MVPPVPVLRPLRALRFGRDLHADLPELVSPAAHGEPVDKNTVGDVHPHNVRRLVRGDYGDLARDDEPRFTHAARLLGRWKEDGVVTRDARPSLYVYEQRSEGVERRGVVGLVRLDRDGNARLLPHEVARGGSTETLRAQLAAMKCQLSLVLAISPDRDGVLAEYLSGQPGHFDVEVHDGQGVQNRIWRDEDPRWHVRLTEALRDEPAVIADGHHRVEAALAHQAERAGGQRVTRERPYDYVMTLLVPASQPGLVSAPTHRVCEHLGPAGRAFLEELDDRFLVTPIGEDGVDSWLDGEGIRFALARPSGVLGLQLRDNAVAREALDSLSPTLRSIEPAVLGATVLDPLAVAELGELHDGAAGDDTGGAPSGATFSHNRASAADVVASALAGELDAAFVLRPVPNDGVVAVAEAGERMPPKSTNFQPKPTKGILMNSLVSF